MKLKPRHLVIAGSVAAASVAGIAAVSVAAVGAKTSDDQEAPITGANLEQASRAALAHTGQGRVTDTEVGDEDSYYEVEVTLEDGTEVDVQLDREFQVVGSESDADGDESEEADHS